ncbi:hypothetical protein F5888DRAFT_1635550 [Russula emetica]|nr:hypothetical protein F5888DRAFT_1635550 [Russula emetica]
MAGQSGDDSITTPPNTSDPASHATARSILNATCRVLVLMQLRNIPHERVYLLDPKAPLALTPSDGDAGYPRITQQYGSTRAKSVMMPFHALLASYMTASRTKDEPLLPLSMKDRLGQRFQRQST